jgi:hypothetical protein
VHENKVEEFLGHLRRAVASVGSTRGGAGVYGTVD